MSHNALLQAALYGTESAFCEVSSTFGTALALIDSVDLSGLARTRERQPHIRQYRHEGYEAILMPFKGKSIKIRFRVPGLGATAAGAVPTSDLWAFLGLLIGNIGNGLATGTTFTGGTAAVPTTTAANGTVAGSLVHGGAVADARVGGQWLPVGAHATNDLTLLLAAPAAPSNGDVLYASKVIYPNESPDTVASVRLRVLTTNGHFDLRGVYPIGDVVYSGSNPGEMLTGELDLGVSHVESTSQTFPSATTPQRHAGAPCLVNGSFAYAAVGVTTRSTEQIRSLSMQLGGVACDSLEGPGGNYEGQINQGCKRKDDGGVGGRIEVVVDQEATGTHTWRDRFHTAGGYFAHIMLSLLVADGKAVGVYAPRAELVGVSEINDGGYNRVRLAFELLTGGTTTTALTRSAWRIGVA